MYRPIDIAYWFLQTIYQKTGASITNLKLLKLLYYAQAWHLVFYKKPLFSEDFEAWAYGPVLTSIYSKFKRYGNSEIPLKNKTVTKFDKETEELLQDVLDVYGDKPGYYLIELTHSEKPWIEARNGLPKEAKCTNIIQKDSMMEYYSQKLKESN